MRNSLLSASILSGLALCGFATAAQAKDVYLAAVRTCVTPAGAGAGNCTVAATPSSTDPVPVWSLVQITSAEFGAKVLSTTPLSSATVPGPLLNVDSGDISGLTIHLLNLLPVPTSLIIPGQPAALVPTWFNPTSGAVTGTGARPAGDTTSRVRSLNTETPAGSTGTYTWGTLKPGSYIYESATHQGIQVQMGLHGGLIVAEGTTLPGQTSATAYGVTYKQQVATYLTEIDAAMHRTIDASPTHDATPAGSARISPLEYWPNIFLSTQTSLTPDFTAMPNVGGHSQIAVGQPTLMRFFNGSLRTHVQTVQDQKLGVIAEDGNAYRYVKNQYTAMLDAGKTKDAMMVPAVIETIAVYDRMLNTGNVGNTQQGMLAFLDIASPSTPTIANVSYTEALGQAFTINAPGVLTNAKSNDGQTLSAVALTNPAHGTLSLATNGGFTYTPTAGSTALTDTFTFKATETVGGTTYSSKPATATIALTVTKPVAVADTYYTTTTTPLSVAAPGVLSNDTLPPGVTAPLTASLGTGPANAARTNGFSLGASGAFNYTAKSGFSGVDTFTYTAISNPGGASAPATVTINVLAAPLAKADTGSVTHVTNPSTSINVLSNDTGATGAKAVSIVRQPTKGSVTVNPDLSVTYKYTGTATRYPTTDTFTYTFTNAVNATSPTAATVTITVN